MNRLWKFITSIGTYIHDGLFEDYCPVTYAREWPGVYMAVMKEVGPCGHITYSVELSLTHDEKCHGEVVAAIAEHHLQKAIDGLLEAQKWISDQRGD